MRILKSVPPLLCLLFILSCATPCVMVHQPAEPSGEASVSSTLQQTGSVESTWLQNWLYRVKLVVKRTPETTRGSLIGIILLYNGSCEGRQNCVSLHGKCNPSFADVLFTLSDGLTILNHVLTDVKVGESALAWIRAPFDPSTGDHVIYLYYGNPFILSDASRSVNLYNFHHDYAIMFAYLFPNSSLFTNSMLYFVHHTNMFTGLLKTLDERQFTRFAGAYAGTYIPIPAYSSYYIRAKVRVNRWDIVNSTSPYYDLAYSPYLFLAVSFYSDNVHYISCGPVIWPYPLPDVINQVGWTYFTSTGCFTGWEDIDFERGVRVLLMGEGDVWLEGRSGDVYWSYPVETRFPIQPDSDLLIEAVVRGREVAFFINGYHAGNITYPYAVGSWYAIVLGLQSYVPYLWDANIKYDTPYMANISLLYLAVSPGAALPTVIVEREEPATSSLPLLLIIKPYNPEIPLLSPVFLRLEGENFKMDFLPPLTPAPLQLIYIRGCFNYSDPCYFTWWGLSVPPAFPLSGNINVTQLAKGEDVDIYLSTFRYFFDTQPRGMYYVWVPRPGVYKLTILGGPLYREPVTWATITVSEAGNVTVHVQSVIRQEQYWVVWGAHQWWTNNIITNDSIKVVKYVTVCEAHPERYHSVSCRGLSLVAEPFFKGRAVRMVIDMINWLCYVPSVPEIERPRVCLALPLAQREKTQLPPVVTVYGNARVVSYDMGFLTVDAWGLFVVGGEPASVKVVDAFLRPVANAQVVVRLVKYNFDSTVVTDEKGVAHFGVVSVPEEGAYRLFLMKPDAHHLLENNTFYLFNPSHISIDVRATESTIIVQGTLLETLFYTPIPNARIKVTLSKAGNVLQTKNVTTDGFGRFSAVFERLGTGIYTVTATFHGMETGYITEGGQPLKVEGSTTTAVVSLVGWGFALPFPWWLLLLLLLLLLLTLLAARRARKQALHELKRFVKRRVAERSI